MRLPSRSPSIRPSRASRHSVAVRADVVEAVIVHAHVGQVRRHPLERAGAAEIEEPRVVGRIELQQRGAELKPLGPLGPAARLVASLDGEDRRASVGHSTSLRSTRSLPADSEEQVSDRGQEIARGERGVFRAESWHSGLYGSPRPPIRYHHRPSAS